MADTITVVDERRHPGSLGTTQLQSGWELHNLKRMHDAEDDDSTVTDVLLADRGPHADCQLSPQQSPTWTPAPHPLFPPLPSYGPPSFGSRLKYLAIRCVSSVLSLLFLGAVVIGALLHSVVAVLSNTGVRLRGRDPRAQRAFHAEERTRSLERQSDSQKWERRQEKKEIDEEAPDECPPLEGGKDPIVSDVAYYARRVGLDVETFKVQTEDGFILTLWHVYNPQEYTPLPPRERRVRGPRVFAERKGTESGGLRRKYPVLLMHGLLQSSGAYCANDDDSLAFFLCKSGYDVWLGNNRCGLGAEHATLDEADPRMWAWNIRHFGVYDLPALVSRVLYETGFEKLGLVAHSQGTTETFVALAKDQRPELGERISVFCALAPAVYAGPLVDRSYFRFMRIISPAAFRVIFGIHSFIPLMMTMHRALPPRIYGALGYYVFSYLFGWSDTRWDRGLRDRMFQFAPVYVSTETMHWWLGPECFATQKCILATRDVSVVETEEDHRVERGLDGGTARSDTAWYGPQTPPVALWVAGSDNLVDGRRLLRRLRNGREPHVRVVHEKIIEDYEHLDVLWAMDAIEQVGREQSFNPDTDIPDLSGKVIFVTGGTSGLGAATVQNLAKHNPAHIYLSGRNANSASAVIQQVQDSGSSAKLTFLKCDLSSLASVKSAAEEFLAQESRLDILICNAGIMAMPPATTVDGYEVQFGTNHLGHALLIRKLLPLLTAAGDGDGGRLVILSSDAHAMHPRSGISFDTLKTTQDSGIGASWVRYGQSKLANLLYARELARRYPAVSTVSIHPGVVRTGLADALSWQKRAFIYAMTIGTMMMVSVEEGVLNSLWAATVRREALVNGAYYVPVGKLPKKLDAAAQDEALAARLWEWTEEALADFL
ncbi:ab-hydrolase associated lipase [Aspergillus terreus]|uniref:Ab-hydrolase associated lipase n=1 Tax=Aspergillus terreus TaxID=33178 RepID=A0A5M3ZCN4_ASPTE|nr:hypothetical protein ATETN484_0011042100 [Aspergillus terreus]GFF19063.1 ab-hydrolase associated lipase [Aspergillus terreus]